MADRGGEHRHVTEPDGSDGYVMQERAPEGHVFPDLLLLPWGVQGTEHSPGQPGPAQDLPTALTSQHL